MTNEEILFKLSMMEQQANEMKQQIEAVDMQINELKNLKASLEEVNKKKGQGMLSPMGRGVFIETEIKDDKFFVNVGSKTFVKKNNQETQEVIDSQIKELERIKMQLIGNIEGINYNLAELVNGAKESK